jgi:transcriptional regulator with XRE-family HTH domain
LQLYRGGMTHPSDGYDALRAFILRTRSELGRSQEDVARRGGFPRGTLSAIEAGRGSIPRQDTMAKIARGLDVPYTMLDRIARGLPADDAAIDRTTDELLAAWERLPEDRREMALRMIQALRD